MKQSRVVILGGGTAGWLTAGIIASQLSASDQSSIEITLVESPDIKTIDQIRLIERRMEIPHEGPFCDLMWSDPEEMDTWAMSPRGAGWLFGSKVTSEFNHINGIELIARAHQLVMDGYSYAHKKKCVTVFSAPNYCYRYF